MLYALCPMRFIAFLATISYGKRAVWLPVSRFVIPAKSRKAGREPGSRKNVILLDFYWIPDLARRRRARPE